MNNSDYVKLSLELHLFFDRIMKEHAEFIRGLLDPSEQKLILTTNKFAGKEGILNCNIKSIIIPLLADHVVREANHFIRILQTLTI